MRHEAGEALPMLRPDAVVESAVPETRVDPAMDRDGSPLRLVVFSLDGQRYGLPLAATEQVLPMVAIFPLPRAPEIVLGAINLHGDVIPVLDTRRRLGLPGGEYGPKARLLVARVARQVVALPADDVLGVAEIAAARVVSPASVHPGIGHVAGLAALDDGLLLIDDLDAFFSIEEERQLAASLASQRP